MTALFDSYIVIDWSASGRPVTGADSIWVAVGDGISGPVLANPPTRAAAEQHVNELLVGRADRRTLLAIDVSLGYPSGTSRQFGLDGTPWSALWTEIATLATDDRRNRNNRFEVAARLNARSTAAAGPFWGCPPNAAGEHLAATKPVDPTLAEFRLTEFRLRGAGWHPKSVWQLLGAGSVGSQTLTALPMLQRLLASWPSRVDVWPFTTGAVMPRTVPGSVVAVEVWPSRFELAGDTARVRDARQVDTTAHVLASADDRGELGEWFTPTLDDAERALTVDEEGWILGPPAD